MLQELITRICAKAVTYAKAPTRFDAVRFSSILIQHRKRNANVYNASYECEKEIRMCIIRVTNAKKNCKFV